MLVEQATEHKAAPSKAKRWIAIIAVVVVVAAAVDAIVLSLNWPFTEKSVREALQNRSGLQVTIGKFYKSYFPPKCVAENMAFLPNGGKNPIITIQRLAVRGDYADLIRFHHRVEVVHVVGMHLLIPPHGANGQQSAPMKLTSDGSGTLQIGKIVADGAVLEFLPGAAGKEPYQIHVERLKLFDVGASAAMRYEATLRISRPPGEIQSTGKFGPWNARDPGQTALSGSFNFNNANLGVSRLVSGILTARGSFSGVLGQVQVTGKTDIPDFHVSGSGHKVGLATDFQATVNGTDGDTFLRTVRARFDKTTVTGNGGVVGKPGRKGKTVDVQLDTSDGRIDDVLRLFIEAKQAPMDGALSMRAHVVVPPGQEDFLKKMVATGEFGIRGGHFTEADKQTPINHLSESAQGEKKKTMEEDSRIVLSNLRGHVAAKNGVAVLSGVSFDVPGARARLDGTFNLVTKQVDLHGVLATTGSLSDASSGFKAVVLKAITPFYKKKNNVKVIPFHITGPYGHTSIGLDTGGHAPRGFRKSS